MKKRFDPNLKLGSLALTGVLAVLGAPQGHAALTFQFNYLTPGVGFSDPTEGPARQSALNSAANLLGTYFTSYNANLSFDVTSENNPSSTTLASAGSGHPAGTGFSRSLVQEKILTGNDPNGSDADGVITWNFGVPGGWDLDDNVSTTAFDFKSTAMHELLHAFGFNTAVANGGKGFGNENPGTPDGWSIFDQFLTDNAGNRLINNNGVFDSSQVSTLTGGTGSNGVFFDGPNAKAANGGNRVNIYSPNPWEEGSSIGHLDDHFFTTQNLMMEAATLPGPGARTLSAIELGILKDIGYTQVAAVPVPATVWLLGSGLVTVFGFGRRQKAQSPRAA